MVLLAVSATPKVEEPLSPSSNKPAALLPIDVINRDEVGLAVALIKSGDPMDCTNSPEMELATVIVKPVVAKTEPPLSSMVTPLPNIQVLVPFVLLPSFRLLV